jgi:hypothetical protein
VAKKEWVSKQADVEIHSTGDKFRVYLITNSDNKIRFRVWNPVKPLHFSNVTNINVSSNVFLTKAEKMNIYLSGVNNQ